MSTLGFIREHDIFGARHGAQGDPATARASAHETAGATLSSVVSDDTRGRMLALIRELGDVNATLTPEYHDRKADTFEAIARELGPGEGQDQAIIEAAGARGMAHLLRARRAGAL